MLSRTSSLSLLNASVWKSCRNPSRISPIHLTRKYTKPSHLETYLGLKQIEKDKYTNISQLVMPYRGRGLFGGTLAAQSVLASLLSCNTAAKKWKPMSIHCHFLIAARPDSPLFYHVHDLKTGKNYRTKEIRLFQNDQLIFSAVCNLQAYKLEGSAANFEGQFDYEREAPVVGRDIAPIEEMLDLKHSFNLWGQKAKFPRNAGADQEAFAAYDREPIRWRLPADLFDLDAISQEERSAHPTDRVLRYWVQVKEPIANPDVFNWVALAYISDYFYLSTNVRLNLREMFTTKFSVSLDHTIHFNKEFDPSRWFNYGVRTLRTCENRALITGEIFGPDGEFGGCSIQEGLSVVRTN